MARICGTVLQIDTFVMSCRVIGRSIETAILHHLATLARADGTKAIEGEIIATKRNGPARDLYERHGIRAIDTVVDWLITYDKCVCTLAQNQNSAGSGDGLHYTTFRALTSSWILYRS